MELLGRVVHSRYRLDAKLATGGSARVYAAWDLVLHRRVAVKVLHPGLADDARFLRRFEAEARAAASLQHPGIVAVHDSGRDAVAFIVLELVDGGSLQDLLDDARTLTPQQAARLGTEVCAALGFAHRRGVVHRDVKPGNILLTADGRAKVADFGIARALSEAAWTEPLHTVLGTARYSAPEVLRGEPPGPTGDLYSLGLVLAEVVTGAPVFAAETPVGVLAGRLQAPAVVPSGLGPLGDVVEVATAPDPSDRYPDALAMQAALAALAGGDPIVPSRSPRVGGPPTTPTREVTAEPRTAEPAAPPPRPSRPRRRRGVALALAVLVLLLAAAVPLWVFVWGVRTVPDVRGVEVGDALSRLETAGLTVVVGDAVTDYSVPAGRVVSSQPSAGEEVRWRGQVRLTPSAGLPRVDVPRLTGQPLDHAVQTLAASQLRVGDVTVVPDAAAPLTVLRHDEGTRTVGDAVAVTVSGGPPPSVVPDVTGKQAPEAEVALKGARLGVAVEEQFDDAPKGTVLSQDVAPAEKVRPGRVVKLTVSKGPDLVTVPDVRSAPVASALERLRSVGLAPLVTSVTGNEFVLKTAPDAGARIKRGSQVTVYTI